MRIITGKVRGLKLVTPKNMDVRPTSDRVKESVFNIIGTKIIGADILDLFAGTGNLGLESWSRGAKKVIFVDESSESLKLVNANIKKVKAEQDVEVIKGRAEVSIENLFQKKSAFDFIFCDPPYNKGLIQKILDQLCKYNILKVGGYLIIEHAMQETIGDIADFFEIVRIERYGETRVTFLRRDI